MSPRANRNLVPGHIWHITHRCHKKEFLLKFHRDKLLWMCWLREAKRRFGLVILNFMITSNHVHLMGMGRDLSRDMRRDMRDTRDTLLGQPGASSPPSSASSSASYSATTTAAVDAAPSPHAVSQAIQLAHARVAQEYNQRKDRHGAFWEDRFHATAIECGAQLARCLTYVDMNMVRAAVVRHPRDWRFCGYDELLRPDVRPRLKLVDTGALTDLVGARDVESLKRMRAEWIDQAIRKGQVGREAFWTESVAVGSADFLARFRGELGGKVKAAEIVHQGDCLSLYRTRRTYLCSSGH